MLALIGIGLDAKDISYRAIEYIKAAGSVIMDEYTSTITPDAVAFIEKETGKKVAMKKRSAFEDDIRSTVAAAKDSKLAILVIGDPLVATTHHIILDEAAKQKIKTAIFHAPSIFSAGIGESGLDIYRFGPTTTIPFWSEHYKPTSFIDTIRKNLSNNEHTLVLFDIMKDKAIPMALDQALDIIKKSDKESVIPAGKKVILLADIGRQGQSIHYVRFSELAGLAAKVKGKTLSLIIPAELNFAEDETTKRHGTNGK